MASIRRTLSPVPRPGLPQNGEACSVSSPLSKSSSCAQSQPPSGGILSVLVSSLDSLAFGLGVFSQRPSRPFDRQKPRVQTWRRALFHFFICFIVGMFVGVTQFASMNASTNSILKYHALSLELSTGLKNLPLQDSVAQNVTQLEFEGASRESNSTFQLQQGEELLHSITQNSSYDALVAKFAHMEVPKPLIVVTTTRRHPFQAYYLNGLAHTLRIVPPPLLWIVVEMTSQSPETADMLWKTGVMYRHLVCNKNLSDVKDERIHQRNVALSHIETHHLDGIVYFADEDNVYAADLFEQIRQIRRFGTWVVAKGKESYTGVLLEGPVCNGTEVIGWHTNESRRGVRRFYAELSGFAFNSTILWDPKRWHRPTLEPIRQFDTPKDKFPVSTFIEQMVEDESQMEGSRLNCSRVMVWHLHLGASNYFFPQNWLMKSNLDVTASLK